MHRMSCVIAGAVLAVTLAGCGDSPPESGPVEFKAAPPSPAIDALREQMSKNVQSATYTKKPVDTDAKAKAATETKPADTKAAPEKKEPEKKP